MIIVDVTKRGILAAIRLHPGCTIKDVNDRILLGPKRTEHEIKELIEMGVIVKTENDALFINRESE